ncbi:3-oxosteroid 1-dehydrogenase [Umezawaea endophytica]|uniref:3-oxosteroid 1-dehydrogenase n=1 Tax=Umezawaea endophytica TaxID=1654476 RepID=A0A9X3AGV7_9PSEU|nr:3-oxosteroid 1-dehydrogenase [Umezawaea endophytica]MCS7480617.1 3-oxosteroid 1-dehydrogenase [Umezawaea endophytica]
MVEDSEFDVVVVGSGGAGMTAALCAAHRGLRVVVVEKAERFGGSTARSGGGLWIPNNAVLREAGVTDTPEQALTYLRHIVGDDVPDDLLRTYLDRGPEMLSFIREHTPLEFHWVRGYADYYPEAPGGQARGRSIEPDPFNADVLGDELANLQAPYLPSPAKIVVTAADYRWLTLVARHPRGLLRAARVFVRRFRRGTLLALGQALSAGLRAGLLTAGVPVRLNTPLVDLHVEDGRVAGVVVGGDELVRARYGVLLAAGGFEHNERMRKEHQKAPIGTEWTSGAKENTGDGIEAGVRAGGAVGLMDDAWWGPSVPLPRGPYFCLSERTQPGCLMVNGAGRRFVNEAAPYVDAVNAMYDGNMPTWLVADQRYRDRYPFAGRTPRQPFPGHWYKAGVVHRADSVEELAKLIDVPSDALAETVRRFNELAETGRDEDFHRGDSAYDRYYGDPRNRPNPCLAPLRKPPFHAVRIVPGDLGTKGGLRTDTRARVLREDGTAIPGLYAAGNSSAAVMGHSYAGPGATLGPAMTFGYLAALDIAAAATTDHRGGTP